MRLTIDECIERIKKPKNRHHLALAAMQEGRLMMHTEPFQREADMPQAFQEWLKTVQRILPADKFERFRQLIPFPLETVNNTQVIFDELAKIFDAPDKAVRFEFTVPEFEGEFWAYVEEKLNDENYWQETGWDAVKKRICSFIIVDLPRQQRTMRPEPYYYMAYAANVYDVEVNEKSKRVECIFLLQGPDKILAIEDTAYRYFVRPQGTGDWVLEAGGEAIHSTYTADGELIDGLGYAPACPFWEHSIEASERINKRGPLTDVLGKLDDLLFWQVSKKYLDLHGAYPIVVSYNEECHYKDEKGNACDHGWIRCPEEHRSLDANIDPLAPTQINIVSKRCPECAKSKLMGPGTNISFDPPTRKEEADLLANPVRYIEMSNDKLEYGVTELERKERVIQVRTTGRVISEATKEAINEDQVRSQYEAQRAKMNIIRKQIESTRHFALETIARLMFGRYFIRGSVFMGKEYFLQSATDIAKEYKEAKLTGLPTYEVARIRESYSNTKYKSDDLQRQRTRILAELYPYPDYTMAELKMMGIEAIDRENFFLKLNFTSLIQRFERENINVVEFGSLLTFDKKISIIHNKLLQYVNDLNLQTPDQAGARPDNGTT